MFVIQFKPMLSKLLFFIWIFNMQIFNLNFAQRLINDLLPKGSKSTVLANWIFITSSFEIHYYIVFRHLLVVFSSRYLGICDVFQCTQPDFANCHYSFYFDDFLNSKWKPFLFKRASISWSSHAVLKCWNCILAMFFYVFKKIHIYAKCFLYVKMKICKYVNMV